MRFSLTTSLLNDGTRRKAGEVETRKLSGFIDRQVDLLKIDVEGSKVEILRDIIHSGKIGFVRQIIVEYHPELASAALDLLVQELRDAGFSCRAERNDLHRRNRMAGICMGGI